jgi:hypothetical protein
MTTEGHLDAVTLGNLLTRVRFDDRGIMVRNYFRTYRIGWAEVSRFTDCWGQWGWDLGVALHNGRNVMAWGATPRSKALIAVGQAAQRYDIPADLTGTIERGSFPATLLGASGTITVTIRDRRLAADDSEAILEVVQRTEPVQPGDILALSHDGTEAEVLEIRQLFARGHWEQVAYVELV